jgi:hypothetical protein
MTEAELNMELYAALKAAKVEFREEKVRQLCWYLLEGRDKADERVVERAVELANDIRTVEKLIEWR